MFRPESRIGRLTKFTLSAVGSELRLLGLPAVKSIFPGPLMRGFPAIRNIAGAFLLWTAFVQAAFATGAEPANDLQVDSAPCIAAAAGNDDDKIISVCGALIDNEKTARSDRIRALIARGGAYDRKDMTDRAIADYDDVLRLDPALADIFNARGELWRRKGDRPKAVADFGMAIKLNPEHPAARGNYKSLAQELERLGVLKAVAGKPSFNCATARRPVEKAICADPELADLDREINAMNIRIIREAGNSAQARALQGEQNAFIARRNAEFGRPDYDLRKAMKERMQKLVGADGY
jgi:tetratricopeptide (TPR) repeat protein